MAVRKIVHIDEEKCDGCGLCIPNCAEGAIQIVDGKAKLVSDRYCDGLGDCLGHCPQDAISIIEREAEEFDEEAVEEHLAKQKGKEAHDHHHHTGCPSARLLDLSSEREEKGPGTSVSAGDVEINIRPQLGQWPVQLHLVPPDASYFAGAHLLVTADCVPVAYPNYHLDLLKGKAVVMGCPKLDDIRGYADKLAAIIKANDLKAITVAYMEVPCCGGIIWAVQEAIKKAGKDVPLERVEIGIRGERK